MDATLFQWAFQQGGITVVAIMAIVLMYRVYTDAVRRERENSEVHRDDKKLMLAAFTENARVLVALQSAIEGLRRGHAE